MKLLITGGAGFIGSNFVRHMLERHPDDDLVVVDKLTYAGNLANLADVLGDPRLRFLRGDVCAAEIGEVVAGADAVVHFAAESHVDRSIEDAGAFVRTNAEGTWRLLEAARRARVGRFLQVSTDEVYGSLGPQGRFREDSPLAPTSPYAATKAAADLLVLAYVRTYGFPAIITRASNNYGPYQFPEKFIPLMIAQAMAGEPLPVYGDGRNVRDWLHVVDHCRALDLILRRGREGHCYNIGGGTELSNLEVAGRILDAVGRPRALIQMVADRPGHDRRYALNCEKLQAELGWERLWRFPAGLAETVDWYRENPAWLAEVRSGAYRDYFARHYTNRAAWLAAVARS
jgi:dTDP-glucose 4,6-dehydratase